MTRIYRVDYEGVCTKGVLVGKVLTGNLRVVTTGDGTDAVAKAKRHMRTVGTRVDYYDGLHPTSFRHLVGVTLLAEADVE